MIAIMPKRLSRPANPIAIACSTTSRLSLLERRLSIDYNEFLLE
jgi:hypothetical protein